MLSSVYVRRGTVAEDSDIIVKIYVQQFTLYVISYSIAIRYTICPRISSRYM